jgi:hypothetical protein
MINYNKKHFEFYTHGMKKKQKQDQFYCRRKQNKYIKKTQNKENRRSI